MPAIYRTRLQFPFWRPNILTSPASLTLRGDRDLQEGVDWFLRNQQADGLWPSGYKDTGTPKIRRSWLWVGLAAGRVFKRLLA